MNVGLDIVQKSIFVVGLGYISIGERKFIWQWISADARSVRPLHSRVRDQWQWVQWRLCTCIQFIYLFRIYKFTSRKLCPPHYSVYIMLHNNISSFWMRWFSHSDSLLLVHFSYYILVLQVTFHFVEVLENVYNTKNALEYYI